MNTSLQPINWNALRTFYGICQYPTLVEAGKHLHITQSALSRSLATLEDSLGYRLFHRESRGLSLLEEGRELLALVAPVFQKFTEYQASRGLNSQIAQGILKVSVAPYLPVSWLMQGNAQFLEQYPDLSLSLTEQVSSSGNFSQYADCAIQFYDAERKDDLIQQPLGRVFYGLYVSHRYLENKGPLKQLSDLYTHPKLILRMPDVETPLGWPRSICYDRHASRIHEFTTAQHLLEAARQGLGIAALPRVQAEEYRDLVALSLPLNDQEVMLYYAYPKYYKDLKRVTAFGDFLKDRNRIQANASSSLSQATEKEQPSSRLPLSYTSEAEMPLPILPQKTQLNSMALSKVMTTVALLSSLFVQACQDVYNDKAQGLQRYEDPLIEKSDLTPTQQIKAYKEDLEKKLNQAVVSPTPEHMKAYMMAEKQGREQAQRFSDAWMQIIHANPGLSRFESTKNCQQEKSNRPYQQDLAAGHYTSGSVFVRSSTRGIELLNVTPPTHKNCRKKNQFFEEAIKDLDQALADPKASNIFKANALFHRGDLNYDLGHFKESLQDFDAVLLIPGLTNEIKSKTLHNRGVVKGILGNHEAAIDDFKASLKVPGIDEDTKANALFNCAVGRSNLKNLRLSLTERVNYIILEQTRESYDDQRVMLDSVFRKAQVSKGGA